MFKREELERIVPRMRGVVESRGSKVESQTQGTQATFDIRLSTFDPIAATESIAYDFLA
jgi:hypothetical protein